MPCRHKSHSRDVNISRTKQHTPFDSFYPERKKTVSIHLQTLHMSRIEATLQCNHKRRQNLVRNHATPRHTPFDSFYPRKKTVSIHLQTLHMRKRNCHFSQKELSLFMSWKVTVSFCVRIRISIFHWIIIVICCGNLIRSSTVVCYE